MKTSNIFKNIPKPAEDEFFQNIIKNEKLKIQRIVSHGHSSPKSGWYEAPDEEWIVLLDGEAILKFIDGKEVRLKSGDYLNIPAKSQHKVDWTKPDYDTIWLVVHY